MFTSPEKISVKILEEEVKVPKLEFEEEKGKLRNFRESISVK